MKKCWCQKNSSVVPRNLYIFWIFFRSVITLPSFFIVGYVWQILARKAIREQLRKGPSWIGLGNRHIMFPEWQEFQDAMPKLFRSFKKISASVDSVYCTEFKCEILRNYSQQGNLYSSYKSHRTMKCYISLNSNDLAYFIFDYLKEA